MISLATGRLHVEVETEARLQWADKDGRDGSSGEQIRRMPQEAGKG